MKKIHLSADPANTENTENGFWWNSGVNSVAGISIDSTGVRFDGRDFTVEISNPGCTNESVEVFVNDVVVFRSVKSKAS